MPFIRFAALFCLLQTTLLQSQGIITTVAGHKPVFPAGGVPARSVSIGADSLAIGPDGSIYVADIGNQVVFKVSPAGILTVVAGNGVPGFSGDGGPATNASLNSPYGLAVDATGALYIADTENGRIRKVSPSGVITTIVGTGDADTTGGSGAATSVGLSQPHGLTIGAAGSLYIADTGDNRILKLSANGMISTIAGAPDRYPNFSGDGGQALSARLYTPYYTTIDAAGAIYIADSGNRRIRKVTPDGVISTIAGTGVAGGGGDGGPAISADLAFPAAIAIDSTGALFIGDAINGGIRKIGVNGIITTVAGGGNASPTLTGPALSVGVGVVVGFAFDSDGALLFSDRSIGLIQKLSSDGMISTVAGNGALGYSGDGGPATSAGLTAPSGIAVDTTGGLYISDPNNSRIRKVTPDGIITAFAGNGSFGASGDGGPATSASLGFPSQLALDSAGALYIADPYTSRIRKVSPNGIITTVAGNGTFGFSGDGGPATSASLSSPYGVAVDAGGSIYISDSYNRRVRKVTPDGIITTVAGNGVYDYTPNTGPATSVALGTLSGVAVDSAGALFISDSQDNLIWKVDPAGMISIVAGTNFSGDGHLAINSNLLFPSGLAVDAAGVLYIAETNGSRIRRLNPDGTISTVAGNGNPGYSGDGGPAGRASLSYPRGVTVDAHGGIYIADYANNRIRKVSPGATAILTVFPLTISMRATAGKAGDSPAQVQIYSPVANTPFQVTTSVPWLTVSSTSQVTEAIISVAADASKLSPGSYSATAKFAIPGLGDAGSQTLSITLTVNPLPPLLRVSNSSIDLYVNQADSPVSQIITVMNAGGGTLAFTAQSDQPWLGVSPASGSVSPTQPATLQISISPNTLAVGSYFANLRINDDVIPVFLIVRAAAPTRNPPPAALRFVPLTPCRVLDTRVSAGTGVIGGPAITGGTARIVAMAMSKCGIPANVNAAAYSLNLTVVPHGPLPYVTVWPSGAQQPLVSTLNSFDGRIKANAAFVPAGSDGSISVYAANTTDAIIDINGYFTQSGSLPVLAYYPVTPCRITDTRNGAALAAGESRIVSIASSACGVPATAQAYSLNMTAVPKGSLSFLTTWPTGQSQPLVSTLNALTGTVTANAAILPAGAGGAINVYATDPTDLVIDINGYFAPPGAPGALSFFAVTPCRISDTRNPAGAFGGPLLLAGESRAYNPASSACAIPSTAKAYSVNATVVPQQTLGFLTLWPNGQYQPLVSTLNSFDGSISSNAAIVPANASGMISAFASNATDLILDINGYFAP